MDGSCVTWHDRAACAGAYTELFFDPASNYAHLREWLRNVYCTPCSVAAECLADAMRTPQTEDHGMRGGLTAGQRRKLPRPTQCRWCGEPFYRNTEKSRYRHCSEQCAKASHHRAKQRHDTNKSRLLMLSRSRKPK